MSTLTREMHTLQHGDVAEIPADVLASVGSFVAREWGDGYRMGYVGAHTGASVEHAYVYVFQVKARDGSRFAVGATHYGEPFELKGHAWLAFLTVKGIEATVKV